MKNCGLALFISIAFHGLIAAGLVFYFDYAPVPDELAQLDLTSVDLSFAETPDETAAVAPASAPQTQAAPLPLPKPMTEPPPMSDPTGPAVPRETKPDTTDLPMPDEPVEQLETPPPIKPTTNNQLPTTTSTSVAPRQAKVDAPPKPRRNIKPDYPRESRLRGEHGNVTLEIYVNAQGTVDDVRVVASSGYPLLDEAAVKAASAALFTPAKSGGRPVPSSARLTLNFKLK